jgi:hypothetical protein
MLIGRFTKKLIVLVVLIGLIVGGNFFLRLTHIKKLEGAIDSLQGKLSDIGITLNLEKYKTKGIFFWDVNLEIEGEIYSTISDSVIYFYIDPIVINSLIDINQNVKIDATLPNKINGRIELNRAVAEKLKIEPKHKVFFETSDIPILHIARESTYSSNDISLNLNDFKVEIQGKGSKDKLVFVENLNFQKNNLSTGESKLVATMKNFNIYLDESKFNKYLPQHMSFDSGSKNIDWSLDLLIKNSDVENIDRVYSGKIKFIAEAFKLELDGEDTVIKNKNEREYHKSDFNFTIEKFDQFMDYSFGLILAIKDSDDEREQIRDTYNLFRKTIKKYSRQSGDITSFSIKDTDDKRTLFQGIPIDEAFKETIDKLKEIS